MRRTDIRRAKSHYALLGLLSVRPMSGYDMKDLINRALSHFWNESYGNIYPVLRRLTEEGLVTRTTERGDGSPDRHVYSLSAAGRDALREWLRAETEEEPAVRSELLLKIFFGRQVGNEVLASLVAQFAEQQREHLSRLQTAAAALDESRKERPEAFYWYLTARRGLIMTEARLRWAEETVRALNTTAHPRRAARRKAAGRKQ